MYIYTHNYNHFNIKDKIISYIIYALFVFAIGVPSSPIVTVESGAGYIIVTVRSENGGVPSDDNSFWFRIIVTDENDVVIHNISYSFPSNSEESLSIDLPVGEYTVSVTSVNKYGTSDETIVGDVSVVLAPSPSPSPSSTDTSTSAAIFGELNALQCPL